MVRLSIRSVNCSRVNDTRTDQASNPTSVRKIRKSYSAFLKSRCLAVHLSPLFKSLLQQYSWHSTAVYSLPTRSRQPATDAPNECATSIRCSTGTRTKSTPHFAQSIRKVNNCSHSRCLHVRRELGSCHASPHQFVPCPRPRLTRSRRVSKHTILCAKLLPPDSTTDFQARGDRKGAYRWPQPWFSCSN